jgi:hypothetical protein
MTTSLFDGEQFAVRICAVRVLGKELSILCFGFVDSAISTTADEADYMVFLSDSYFGCIAVTRHFTVKRVCCGQKVS